MGDRRLRALGMFSLEQKRLWGDLKGTYSKDVARLLIKARSDRTRKNGLKQKETRFRLATRIFFLYEGGEALKQLVQRSCDHPIHGTVQGQAGPVEDVPAHGTGVGMR